MTPLPTVEIYCDGAAIPNPGAAGIGVILIFGTVKKELSEPIGHASNQAAEIQAATTALMALNRACNVVIYSDSMYLIKTMNGEYSRRTNIDLWNDLDFAALKHEVQWVWMKGHAGHPIQERADELANNAAKRNGRGA